MIKVMWGGFGFTPVLAQLFSDIGGFLTGPDFLPVVGEFVTTLVSYLIALLTFLFGLSPI